MNCKVIIVLAAAAVCRAGVVPVHGPVAPRVEEYDPNPQYTFTYRVEDQHTGDSKSQHETRQGDVVQGEYSLVEPDGSRRVVEYTADDHNGFNAIVHREQATHPYQPSAAYTVPAPAYTAAVPTYTAAAVPAYTAAEPAYTSAAAPAYRAAVPAYTTAAVPAYTAAAPAYPAAAPRAVYAVARPIYQTGTTPSSRLSTSSPAPTAYQTTSSSSYH